MRGTASEQISKSVDNFPGVEQRLCRLAVSKAGFVGLEDAQTGGGSAGEGDQIVGVHDFAALFGGQVVGGAADERR